jgi:hypothetical protein
VARARRGARRWLPPSTLPPLYAPWIADLLGGPLPAEPEATCEDCAMCGTARAPSELVFDPETKCCTYVPALPNFLVGRILGDGDPALAAGRASVERRIDARLGVTPLGLEQPPVHALLYKLGAAAFGRSRTLRCPHYLPEAGGACGIWRHRNGVCSTWFCKYGRGATGQRFWQALDQLLATVERELSRWCLVRLDLDPALLGRLLPRGTDRGMAGPEGLDAAAIDGRAEDAVYRAYWGAWHGRERDLYRESARLVAGLRWTDVVRLGGASVEAHARIVTAGYAGVLSETIPRHLVAGQLVTVATGRHHVRVSTYNSYDPLDLPRLLVDALAYFDGRPTAEALRRVRDELRVNLQPALVRRLVDFGVLISPDRPERT